jgi:carbamoyltransferase
MVTVLGLMMPMGLCGHETGACIVKDGRIVAAINEDRITGIKHDGSMVYNSIKEVLRIAKIEPSRIDAVAVPWMSPAKSALNRIATGRSLGIPLRALKISYGSYGFYKTYDFTLGVMLDWFDIDAPVHYVSHHLSHAASAYYTSGFGDATVVTIDGIGENICSAVYAGGDGLSRVAATKSLENSPGYFYIKATQALGFKANDGEGKTMGLASYGDSNKHYNDARNFLSVDGLQFKGNFGKVIYDMKIEPDDRKFSWYRYDRVGLGDNPFLKWVSPVSDASKITQVHMDVAASAQKVLEECVCRLVYNSIRKTFLYDVALAGGVALNCKMNQKIRELTCTDDVFIHPNPGDAGVFTGAALHVCHKLMGSPKNSWKMEHAYYGTEYSNEEIESALNEYHLDYEKVNDPAKAAAEFIGKGQVVGWFQGRLEYGPRALGNRSVLADPRDINMKDRINRFLKKRDWFMPFCPSILSEAKDDWLADATDAPFMIMGFDAVKGKAKEIPAVVHVDDTIRPQTVDRDVNPLYWTLINDFKKETGIPLVLNTSFNKHGLPMVRSPQDAINHFLWDCVDVLIIGNYLIRGKKGAGKQILENPEDRYNK